MEVLAGPVVSPNQPSLVMLMISPGRSAPCTTARGENGLITDERSRCGQARRMSKAVAASSPVSKPPRRRASCCSPITSSRGLQRQVLSERHKMDLVVECGKRPVLSKHQKAVVDASWPGAPRGRIGSARKAPAIEERALRQQATNGGPHLRVSRGRNGMAASGQITWVTPARSSVTPAGLVADKARWSRNMRL